MDIIIPTYNGTATLGETLDSLVAQGPALEEIGRIWLADDGSSDNTVAFAMGWKDGLPLETVPVTDNLGQSGNLNRAVAYLPNEVEWFLLLHQDDIVRRDWLPEMLGRIKRCPREVGSISSAWDDILPNGTIAPGESDTQRAFDLVPGNAVGIEWTLIRGCWWRISGCAIRRKAFDDVGGFDVRFRQQLDWEWLLRCLWRGWSIEYIPRPVVAWRQHPDSLSSANLVQDLDLREGLEVLKRFGGYASERTFKHLLGTWRRFAMRRLARGLINLSPRRVTAALRTIQLIQGSVRPQTHLGAARHPDPTLPVSQRRA